MRRVALLVSLLVVLACGGTAPFSGRSDIFYSSDWTQHDALNGGESQRVTLTIPGQAPAATMAFNRTTTGRQTIRFEGLADGRYILHADLYQDADLKGPITGVIETVIDLQTTAAFESVVGVDPTAVAVVPNAITLAFQQGWTFYAHGKTGANVATFAKPSDFEWSMNPVIGTISQSGRFEPASPGFTTITVKHLPTGIVGTAEVTSNSE